MAMNNWHTIEGSPNPLGVSWVKEEQAYNFTLYSKHAESVTLLFYGRENVAMPLLTWPLEYLSNKSGRIWHCRIAKQKLAKAKFYAYSINGPKPQGRYEWHYFDPEKILLDPYAEAVFFPPGFDRYAAIQPGSNAGKAPLGVLTAGEHVLEGKAENKPRHEADAIICELHVRGFTMNPNSGVESKKRGSFLGLVDKIPYLLELGVTVVELMPVFQFDPQEGNYWGYMPLNFFAPHNGYAMPSDDSSSEPHREFRQMVDAFHAAGVEVVLDVVYNHTCEGNQRGPVYSFKGVDNSTFYLISDRTEERYENFTGAGNTLNCANRFVRKMVLDSLRHWANKMGVDGFRFDLASVFSRKTDGSINLDDPQLFADIISDPELVKVRLIAEPWDLDTNQLGGRLPGVRWSQWNGCFRDDMRRFLRGDNGLVGSMMSRLYGSDDLFPDGLPTAFHPYQSINYITSHDGFTLYDLVSYSQKCNQANGHNNTDGTNENFSWNCGWEGDEGLPSEILKLRKQQVKNFCCLLFLSNGTPMIRAGDEFMQTQQGNNNPYNQDNETSWLDWNLLKTNQDTFRFFKTMIAFRKAHPSLCRSRYWREDIHWHGKGPETDRAETSHSLAFHLEGAALSDDDIYVMINAGPETLTFQIQAGKAGDWKRVVDTSLASPEDILEKPHEIVVSSATYEVRARSVVVLVRPRTTILAETQLS
jgi:isoamylase